MSEPPGAWEGGQAPSEDEEARRRAAEADDTLAPGSMPPEAEASDAAEEPRR